MNLKRYSHARLAEKAKQRPPGYLDDLMRCAVGQDAEGVVLDRDSPMWEELSRKYAPPRDESVPPDQWPVVIRLVASRRRPADTGVGDTARRILAHLGADALAWLYEKATGRDCGCGDRQGALNRRYPFLEHSRTPERPQAGGEQHHSHDDGDDAGHAPKRDLNG